MEKQTGSGQFSQHLGQKFGKKLGREIGRKGEAIGQKFDEHVDQLGEKVTAVAATVNDTAKTGLDQILLNLEHRGLNFKDKQEIIHRVGKTVLDRAEKIRAQITENSPLGAYAPSWMKESLVKTDEATATAEASGSMTESTVSEPAQEMQTNTLKDEIATALEDEADRAEAETPKKKSSAKSKKASK